MAGSQGRGQSQRPGVATAGTDADTAGRGADDFGPGPMQGMLPVGPIQAGSDGMMMMPVSSSREPISIDECGASNPAGLSDADVQRLMAGASQGALRVLYPYDGTVFPRGIFAPLIMWDGVLDSTAVYIHIKAMAFEYKGCLPVTADGQLQLPEEVWKKAGEQTYGANDLAAIELSVLAGGDVTGPVRLSWTIAQATIKGSIYYNSYSSLLPNTGGLSVGGNVLRIPPGGTAERFVSITCNGCHSVSANGSRLLSQLNLAAESNSFGLSPNSTPNPPGMSSGPRGSFGALYPDGSVYLSTSVAVEVARAAITQGLGAPIEATLYRTDTGEILANTGIPTGALMPMFSPDGKLLVFNDFDIDLAHGLAVMDYDSATHTASNRRVLFTDSAMRPGWPFVLPDNGGVVFTRTDGADFSGEGAGLAGLPLGPSSDLYVADIATNTVTVLAKAMGYLTPDDMTSDKTYLPFGAEELHRNYFPTVSPVAAGGYFWVLFDAVRHYGNLGSQRQLWGAAITISPDGSYTSDPSHPAFYLPGQEFGTGNHRAFAALDPCRMDGDDCTSGIDCCGGFCYVPESDDEFGVELAGTCTSEVPECAKTNERCSSDEDCCPPEGNEPANSCIAGFCATVAVVL